MSEMSKTSNRNLTAGIIALKATEAFAFRPLIVVAERERSHLASLIKESFSKLADISARASIAMRTLEDLEGVLAQGRAYFLSPADPSQAQSAPLIALRNSLYELCKMETFEKVRKKMRDMPAGTITIHGAVFTKSDLIQTVSECHQIESRRVTARHRFLLSVRDCTQHVKKDPHLLAALCFVCGFSHPDAVENDCKKAEKEISERLAEWDSSATNASLAFHRAISFEGWIRRLVEHTELFPLAAQEISASNVSLSRSLSPGRKQFLVSIASDILDDMASLARKHTAIPETPTKDLLRVHFLLTELQKPLPAEVAQAHHNLLSKITGRLLEHPDFTEYLFAFEHDSLLPGEEKDLVVRHFVHAQTPRPPQPHQNYEEPTRHERRTAIRRDIKASLERERTDQAFEEILARMQELRETAPEPAPTRASSVIYFSPRLEQDFEKWLSGFQDFIQKSARSLLDSAAMGAQVDAKTIKRETKIFELRLVGGGGIRIYCTRADNHDLVVLGYGSKQTQDLDITTAIERYRIFRGSAA